MLGKKIRLPTWCSGKESACQSRRHRICSFDPWVGKIPWRRKWQPTPVFLPGKSHREKSLAGYSQWGRTESDTTEVTQHARNVLEGLLRKWQIQRQENPQSFPWDPVPSSSQGTRCHQWSQQYHSHCHHHHFCHKHNPIIVSLPSPPPLLWRPAFWLSRCQTMPGTWGCKSSA